MKRILSIILQVLLSVFVVGTVGFLLFAFVLIINGGEINLPPLAQNILQGVAIVYLADIALLLLCLAGFLVHFIVDAIRQGQGKRMLKPLLIQVPLAIMIGVLIEVVGRLISYDSVAEGGVMYTPIILALVVVVYRVFPKK